MTLDEIRASRPTVDCAKIGATTEADIRRQQIEDGENSDAPPPPFRPVPNVRAIRTKLQMTQEAFATAIGVPVATVRNWEQSRTSLDPAVCSLLRVVEREPDAALRALAGKSRWRVRPVATVLVSSSALAEMFRPEADAGPRHGPASLVARARQRGQPFQGGGLVCMHSVRDLSISRRAAPTAASDPSQP
jgi:putative transcriptional regulator